MSEGREHLVLVVDDDPDLLELIERSLEREDDMMVLTARDGERALRLLQVLTPDVIVTDLMMPILDGLGFLRQYKQRPEGAPVLAISALGVYLDQARRLGADATLPKPFELPKLIELVRQMATGAPPSEAPPPPAPSEALRLQAIVDLELEQRAPEEWLEGFLQKVALQFSVETALISIVTEDRQRWAAACGLPEALEREGGTPREQSFCTHAVNARAALVVQDACDNPFFRDNPVVAKHRLRFYAGVPLIARHGQAVGTLCLLDTRPRRFTHPDLELLAVFGRCVMSALEWREKRQAGDIPDAAFRYLHYVDQDLDCFGRAAFVELAVVECARAVESATTVTCVVVAMPPKRLAESVDALRRRHPAGLVGRLGYARLGWLVPDTDAPSARRQALEATGPHAFAEAVDLSKYPGAPRQAVEDLELALGDAGLA